MNKTLKNILSSIVVLAACYSTASAEGSKYYGGNLCAFDAFECVTVKGGDTWAKLFPNPQERELVKRLNRTNIPLRYRQWIVVPKNLSKISTIDLSPFPDRMQTGGERLVIVNLGLQAFGAYDEQGALVRWGPISGGKGWCSEIGQKCETVTGSFRITEMKGPECISNTFPVETGGGAPMPYCMSFYRGFALHGSTLPGYNASHGCVRLFFEDAKWLNEQFVTVGTRVIVTR